jgi:hypothetical protein
MYIRMPSLIIKGAFFFFMNKLKNMLVIDTKTRL